MKKNLLYGTLFLMSLGMASCSQDDMEEKNVLPNEQTETAEGFKTLANFTFGAEIGNPGEATLQSRTPADIDKLYCPTGEYPLDYVWMMAVNPEKQPTGIGYQDLGYRHDPFAVRRHEVGNRYTLKYKLNVTENDMRSSRNRGITYPGTIFLQHGNSEPLEFRLSIFTKKAINEATKTHQIPLNSFAYAYRARYALRGTALRYTSYNPYEVGVNNDNRSNENLSGQYVTMPELTQYYGSQDNILKAGLSTGQKLVTECKDEYFTGSEFLIAADDDGIYLLQVVNTEGENGGYFKVRQYKDMPTGTAQPEELALNRLTTMINASFMLIDEENPDQNPYFKSESKEQTLKNFKQQYGVDLQDLECPYATIDGVNTKFYINEYVKDDKTTEPGRLALWAKGHKVTAANGTEHEKKAEASMRIKYNNGAQDNTVSREGYGILGNSYSVAFMGNQGDNKNQNVSFWVNVDDAKIRISVPLAEGLALNRNYSHNIICYVPAGAFAQAVKDYKSGNLFARSNADGYVDLKLSSDCAVVK